jgi:hypothetical protein
MMAMTIWSSTERRGAEFIPVVEVDGARRYFAAPQGEPDHIAFTVEAEARAHAENMVDVLRKTVLYTLEEAGFITPLPEA